MSASDNRQIGNVPPMTAATDVETANRLLSSLEGAWAERRKISGRNARVEVAGKLNTSPRTLEKIATFDLKTIPHYLMARIRALTITVLQNEIRLLEHEVNLAKQTDMGNPDDLVVQAEAHIAATKALLGSRRSGVSA